jgi:hypothetical protein
MIRSGQGIGVSNAQPEIGVRDRIVPAVSAIIDDTVHKNEFILDP